METCFFTKMVDELVEFSEFDPELAEGIKWIDNNSKIPGDDFYEKINYILNKHEINKNAREWLNKK